ncbi:MAG: hypothetical protein QNJ90_11080 [Planctomycetota bacterium]|nr:hypothetical protein [Planctomycetota bacterium]
MHRQPLMPFRLLALAAALLLAWAPAPADAETRRSRFNPSTHGFNFINDFNNDFVAALDIRTGGLCGGMVYTALDYFSAGMRIPRQDYRPANRTTLQSYIYNRQVKSIVPNVPKWANMGLNPNGKRNAQLFRRAATSEFNLLKAKIDAGTPVPLGVHGIDGVTHQIMAVGYKRGRAPNDVQVYVYDPNHKNKIITMRSQPGRNYFYYVGYMNGDDRRKYMWRTFFTDTAYRPVRPPALRDSNYPSNGRVHELLLHMETGDDDLRGKNDNVNLTIHMRDGRRFLQRNINRSARWLSNYTEFASVKLTQPLQKSGIAAFELWTTFRGGVAGDNWDLKRVTIEGYTGGTARERLAHRSSFFRFTGSRKNLRINVGRPAPAATAGQVTALRLQIKTGGDDLRGNNDNVHAVILFRSGTRKMVQTINARQRWADNSERTVDLPLDRPVNRNEITGVELRTTARGGTSGDNWNMAHLRVIPLSGGDTGRAYFFRQGRPLHRFTGRNFRYTARW